MLELPEDLRQTLISWARWCRGPITDAQMAVICKSIESRYLPFRGDTYETVEALLERQLRRDRARDSDMIEVETVVMRLPDKHRSALRLEFVVYKAMPLAQKRRILGVTEDAYWLLVRRAAFMVRNNEAR